jgi:hypothetical protein
MAMVFKARVHNGRLVLDAPTQLPEGAEVELISVDDMSDEERQELEQALADSEEDLRAGRVYSAADVLDELRRQ